MWFELGYRLRSVGDYPAAVAPLARNIELGRQGHPEELKYLGETLLGLQWLEEGRTLLSRYLELVPDDRSTPDGSWRP